MGTGKWPAAQDGPRQLLFKLFVGEPDSSRSHLLNKDAVLFPEIVDRRLLVAADPAGKSGEKDMPGLVDLYHGRILGDR